MRNISTIILLICVFFATQAAFAADQWVGTWAAGQQLTETNNNPPSPGLPNNTLRQVVHATIGGNQLRVEFSNAYGNGPLTINSAHIAVATGTTASSAINTATDKALTFQGAASVTIATGQSVYSDTVSFSLTALSNVAVTVYFGSVPSNITGHPGSRTTSYIQTGNAVTAASMTSAVTTDHWYVLSGIDVLVDQSYAAAVVLGDSISDGRGSTTNANNRWPDAFAARLQANANTNKVAVLNMGIGGNTVLSGGLGPTALTRFDHDVLAQDGVKWLIILEGVNDINGGAQAASLTSAFQQFIDKAHAKNILVYGMPILPFGASQYSSAANESVRQSVNNWIRTSGKFDAVIDVDAAVRDPANTANLLAAYDSGDHLHLSVAGYQKMADAINLALFQVSTVKTGDVDGNGTINIIDAMLVAQYSAGLNPANFNTSVADITGDSKIDILDALRIARVSAGLQ